MPAAPSRLQVLAHKASPDAVDLMQAACLLAEMVGEIVWDGYV